MSIATNLPGAVALVLAVPLTACAQLPAAPDQRRVIVSADVDHAKPVNHIEYKLADEIWFSITYLSDEQADAEICFSTADKHICRTSVLPADLPLRPVAIIRDASNEIMIGFETSDSEALDIWLSSDPDVITVGYHERACVLRGLPPTSPDCF